MGRPLGRPVVLGDLDEVGKEIEADPVQLFCRLDLDPVTDAV
jgi:hypothetical protein